MSPPNKLFRSYLAVLSIAATAIGVGFVGLSAAYGHWAERGRIRATAARVTGGDPDRGAATIAAVGCGACHTIPGIDDAAGLVGPPLTHVAGRHYLAGVVRNTPDNLIAWLKDPPAVDPKTAMSNLRLTDPQARDVAAYLYTLK
ncbi:MAG: cytochrome c family protein [Phycisphaerae bacterium]|nr:c-type cytochrome [Tepidisphaeraceae bacterium]